jgi:DNA-binding MarR family transcriptional regulator
MNWAAMNESTTDAHTVASDLRPTLGRLLRRLRAEQSLAMPHASVLGRLDREHPQCVSDLARADGVRPQSMAQTVRELEAAGLVRRKPDIDDRRRALVELTAAGRTALRRERLRREDWLANAIADQLTPNEQELLAEANKLLGRLAES